MLLKTEVERTEEEIPWVAFKSFWFSRTKSETGCRNESEHTMKIEGQGPRLTKVSRMLFAYSVSV